MGTAAYTCKVGFLSGTWTYSFAGGELLVGDAANKIHRRIKMSEIKKLKLFHTTLTRDPKHGRGSSEICVLIPSAGKPVYIRSGTYIRPAGKIGEVVIDQRAQYNVFLNELKQMVYRNNPGVPVVTGNLMASLIGWFGVAMGFGFLAFTVGGFIMDKLPIALGIALFCVPVGLTLIMAGKAMGTDYWPNKVRIDEHIKLTSGGNSEPL